MHVTCTLHIRPLFFQLFIAVESAQLADFVATTFMHYLFLFESPAFQQRSSAVNVKEQALDGGFYQVPIPQSWPISSPMHGMLTLHNPTVYSLLSST